MKTKINVYKVLNDIKKQKRNSKGQFVSREVIPGYIFSNPVIDKRRVKFFCDDKYCPICWPIKLNWNNIGYFLTMLAFSWLLTTVIIMWI